MHVLAGAADLTRLQVVQDVLHLAAEGQLAHCNRSVVINLSEFPLLAELCVQEDHQLPLDEVGGSGVAGWAALVDHLDAFLLVRKTRRAKVRFMSLCQS